MKQLLPKLPFPPPAAACYYSDIIATDISNGHWQLITSLFLLGTVNKHHWNTKKEPALFPTI